MKYLGIDYGSRYTGTAISDSTGQVAMPARVYSTDKHLVETILELVDSEGIETIVVGESKNFEGGHNSIQRDINQFVRELERETSIPIHSVNEQFSSRAAKWGITKDIRSNPRNTQYKQSPKKEARIDDKAAAIILQSYLDSQ